MGRVTFSSGRAPGLFSSRRGLTWQVVRLAFMSLLLPLTIFALALALTYGFAKAALREGFRLLKWFPAEPLGGARGLRALAAPFAHLGVRHLPLGGIDEAKAPTYLAEPAVAAVGGSWIAPAGVIGRREWDAIRSRAAAAVALAGAGLLSI